MNDRSTPVDSAEGAEPWEEAEGELEWYEIIVMNSSEVRAGIYYVLAVHVS